MKLRTHRWMHAYIEKCYRLHVSRRKKEQPIKGSAVLKQVILITNFYRCIFLVHHLVLSILIVSYDALSMNSTWFIRPMRLYKKTYEVKEMNKTKLQLRLYK